MIYQIHTNDLPVLHDHIFGLLVRARTSIPQVVPDLGAIAFSQNVSHSFVSDSGWVQTPRLGPSFGPIGGRKWQKTKKTVFS